MTQEYLTPTATSLPAKEEVLDFVNAWERVPETARGRDAVSMAFHLWGTPQTQLDADGAPLPATLEELGAAFGVSGWEDGEPVMGDLTQPFEDLVRELIREGALVERRGFLLTPEGWTAYDLVR